MSPMNKRPQDRLFNRPSNTRRFHVRLLVTLALVCSYGFALGGQSGERAGQHYSVNAKGEIVDPSGEVFIPHGANVAIAFTRYPYVFEGNSRDGEPDTSAGGVNSYERWSERSRANVWVTNKVRQLRAWGFNTLRVGAVPFGDNNKPTLEETIEGVKKGVDEMTQAGFVVVLDMHSATGKDPQIDQKSERDIRAFWDATVPYFRNNPRVWFNFFNEPFKDGTKIAEWIALHSFYVRRYRAEPYRAHNLIVCDLPRYGQALDMLADGALDGFAKEHPSVVFGWHAYGSVGSRLSFSDTADPAKSYAAFDKLLTEVRGRRHAIIVGEVGMAHPKEKGNAGPWQWNVNGFNNLVTGQNPTSGVMGEPLARKHGVGLLLWHLTGDASHYHLYAMRKDRGPWWKTVDDTGKLVDRQALTEQARLFWDYVYAKQE